MLFEDALGDLATWLWNTSARILQLSDDIRDVWLLGEHLSDALVVIKNFLDSVRYSVNDFRVGMREFYIEYRTLADNVGDWSAVSSILDAVRRVVDFPSEWLAEVFAGVYPTLHALAADPGAWVVDAIAALTGITREFMADPRGVVDGWVRDILAEYSFLPDDPFRWILDVILASDDWLADFVRDPLQWTRNTISLAYPGLSDFLGDPVAFIRGEFLDALDQAVETGRDRLVGIAERLLNSIF